jgi:hypothetical protein
LKFLSNAGLTTSIIHDATIHKIIDIFTSCFLHAHVILVCDFKNCVPHYVRSYICLSLHTQIIYTPFNSIDFLNRIMARDTSRCVTHRTAVCVVLSHRLHAHRAEPPLRTSYFGRAVSKVFTDSCSGSAKSQHVSGSPHQPVPTNAKTAPYKSRSPSSTATPSPITIPVDDTSQNAVEKSVVE